MENMCVDESAWIPLEKYIIIYDDILGDSQLKSM